MAVENHSVNLVLIAGSPGVGKTTVARELAKEFELSRRGRAVHIELDVVREMAMPLGGPPRRPDRVDLWLRMAASVTAVAVSSSALVVVDGTMIEEGVAGELRAVAKAILGSRCRTVRLIAPVQTCLQRNQRRRGSRRLPDAEVIELWEECNELGVEIEIDAGPHRSITEIVNDVARLLE